MTPQVSLSGTYMHEAIISSDDGLLPVWHQAMIWTNAGLLSIRP